MSEWIRALLDVILIAMVGAGLWQAARLIRHLAGLQQGRVEMERFVHEFSATVFRAEAGIKGLKHTARESGDDLEKLVEKANLIRDELMFLVESADQIAERLSNSASVAVRPDDKASRTDMHGADMRGASESESKDVPKPAANRAASPAQDNHASNPSSPQPQSQPQPSSRAEKELLQALQKLS